MIGSLKALKLGETIRGHVEDVLDQREVIIAIRSAPGADMIGVLIRVANESGRILKRDDPVTLLVRALEPLRFQILDERGEQRRKGHLDLSV